MRGLSIAVVALAASGCATTLSTHQLARPIQKGHVQGFVGTGIYIPAGASIAAAAAGAEQFAHLLEVAQTGEPYEVTPEERERLITAGVALAVFPPLPAQEVSLRTGVHEKMDLGLRYSINALRLDSKYWLHHRDDGAQVPADSQRSFDVSVGLAVSRYLFDNPVVEALDFVQLGDFSRWDVEVPVYVSWEWGQIFRTYVTPKYVFSHTSFDENLVNLGEQYANITGMDAPLGDTAVVTHFFGASAGFMLGYKYAYLSLELTGGYTWCRPVVLGRRRDLGGMTLYPSIGLDLRY